MTTQQSTDQLATVRYAVPGNGPLTARSEARKPWTFQCDAQEEYVNFHMPPLRHSSHGIRDTHFVAKTYGADIFDDDVATGSLAFVESNWFQGMTGVVIFLNCILIGLETDMGTGGIFPILEHCSLTYFVVELVLRIMRFGCSFFSPESIGGNLFDSAIVLSGVVDMWLNPLIAFLSNRTDNESDGTKVVVGMMRMLRIVRLVRLVKIIKPLYTLAMGIAEAVQGMVWVLVFLIILLYAVSIVTTRLIGHHIILPEDASEEAVESAKNLFGTISASMFALFELMSCWSMVNFNKTGGFLPFFRMYPMMQWAGILFYISTAWALLAVMTGVVSEKMLAVREQLAEDDKRREEDRFQQATNLLHQLFLKADADGSNEVSEEEFKVFLMHPQTKTALQQYTSIAVSDLEDLFAWLDIDGDGTLSIEEFMHGFRLLNETFSQKTLLKMQQELTVSWRKLGVQMKQAIDDAFDKFLVAAKDPMGRVNVITEQIQRIDINLSGQAQRLKTELAGRITRKQLYRSEERLDAQLDALLSAVERLDELHSLGVVEFTPDFEEYTDNAWNPRTLGL